MEDETAGEQKGSERGLLAVLSGIPAGLGRGSRDSMCGA